MTGTFNTPFGRLRVGSSRRYILVTEDRNGKPRTVRRSDTFSNLSRHPDRSSGDVVLDTLTGNIVFTVR
jgi:hypothetical protein